MKIEGAIDSDSTQTLLLKMSHLYFRNSFEQLSNLGVHPGQLPMIKLLGREGGLSQREISDKLRVKPPSVAVSIKRMESAGLLGKSPDKKDQRVTRIYLSPKGREMNQEIEAIVKRNEKVLFQGFTESEQCLMRRFLLQIIKNLEELKTC